MKTVVLTGGGTSGHVTPNIALLPGLKSLGFDIHYIGSKNGIEKQLIQKEGIPYHAISAGKLRRYLDMKNITDIFRIMGGFAQALSVLGKVKPDVVFSKGGFVSCPVVWAAWFRRVPVIIHESDITPGLTNKLSMPFAKKVCYTFPESEKHMSNKKACLTGLPVRPSIMAGDRAQGYRLCGFSDKKPVLMIIGGSQGSENINKAVRQVLQELLQAFQVCHICGNGNVKPELEGMKGYRQFEYVNDELKDLFASSDILVSRAGATTLFEILALRRPALLIPLSKNASRGDQILNAESFQRQGYSDVLSEESLSGDALLDRTTRLYLNRSQYIRAMQDNPFRNGAETIVELIHREAGGNSTA
jgi:UDP-N-acetylglucosamine--N-acetylmuramyl-(pentapeptide) pyrophosphoryl-undecaprenol N-acetylglucosamine transferase